MELHPLSRDTGERGVDQEAALSRMWPPRPWGLKPAPIEPNGPALKVVNWGGGWEGYEPAIKRQICSLQHLCLKTFWRTKTKTCIALSKGIPIWLLKLTWTHYVWTIQQMHIMCLFLSLNIMESWT